MSTETPADISGRTTSTRQGTLTTFRPRREAATNPDVKMRDHFAFGVGRRVCQGMHIADRSMFLIMSRLLWAFDFEKATDAQGNKITPHPLDVSEGIVIQPLRFPVKDHP